MTTAFKARVRKLLFHNVLHADDTPHQIALGVAVATWVAFLPLIGIQTILSVSLAAALRANKAVCFPIVWITNPLTAAPIYGMLWKLGSWLTGSKDHQAYKRFILAVHHDGGMGRLLDPVFWTELFNLLISIGKDLWIGSAVAATVLAVLGYFLSLWAVSDYRQRFRAQRSKLRRERRLLRPRRAPRTGGVVSHPIPAAKP